MKKSKFSISKRLKSFQFAYNGLRILLKEEHNSQIHFSFSVLVILFGIIFKITTIEWLAIIFAIGLVISLELIT